MEPKKKKTKTQIKKEAKEARQKEIDEDVQSKFDLRVAIANGNAQMNNVSNANEKKNPGWFRAAVQCIVKFPKAEFLVEEIREWSYANGLLEPTSHKAWGAPANALGDSKFMKKCGSERSSHVNENAPTKLKWRKTLTGNEHYGDITPEHAMELVKAKKEKEKADKKAAKKAERGGVAESAPAPVDDGRYDY